MHTIPRITMVTRLCHCRSVALVLSLSAQHLRIISVEAKPATVDVNTSTFKVRCVIFPPTKVTWIHERYGYIYADTEKWHISKLIPQRRTIALTSTLTVFNVEENDRGWYKCVILNNLEKRTTVQVESK